MDSFLYVSKGKETEFIHCERLYVLIRKLYLFASIICESKRFEFIDRILPHAIQIRALKHISHSKFTYSFRYRLALIACEKKKLYRKATTIAGGIYANISLAHNIHQAR